MPSPAAIFQAVFFFVFFWIIDLPSFLSVHTIPFYFKEKWYTYQVRPLRIPCVFWGYYLLLPVRGRVADLTQLLRFKECQPCETGFLRKAQLVTYSHAGRFVNHWKCYLLKSYSIRAVLIHVRCANTCGRDYMYLATQRLLFCFMSCRSYRVEIWS